MSESTVIDEDVGIWIVEIPVHCETRGHLVLCNEESIGYIEHMGGDDYLATMADRGRAKSIGGYPKIHQAARAIAHEALGSMVFEDTVPDDATDEQWDAALDNYIKVGPTPFPTW